MRFELFVLGGMQNNSYLFSHFSQELNTIMVDPLLRSLQDSHQAQGHVTLALKMMHVLREEKYDGVKMLFCPDDLETY